MDILQSTFGHYNSEKIMAIKLINDNNVASVCLTLGASWYEFLVPTKNKGSQNILLNLNNITAYIKDSLKIGKSIGRVAGVVQNGEYNIGNAHYVLPQNDGNNTLDGGPHGFSYWNWNYTTSITKDSVSVIFQKQINEAMDGFPGNILATIIYTLDNNNKVSLSYSAMNGKIASLFDPTCNVYFDLNPQHDLSTQELQVNGNGILVTDKYHVPTGDIREITDTPYDFDCFQNVGQRLNLLHDLNEVYLINDNKNKSFANTATIRDKTQGHQIILNTERSGLRVHVLKDQGAIGLKVETLPDAIHHPDFGNIILPKYSKRTYHFSFTYHSLSY